MRAFAPDPLIQSLTKLGSRTFATMLAWACTLLIGTATVPPAMARETVNISYQRSSTLLILLKQSGELDKKLAAIGYDVSWHEFAANLATSINAGSVDINSDVADAYALFTQAAHAPLTYYAEETSSPGAQAIIVPTDSPIHSIADLKGKRVAVSKGSGCNFLLLAALKKAGLTTKDIQISYLEAPDGLAAFTSRSVDAWVIWDPFLAAQQREAKARVIADGSNGLTEYNRFYTARGDFADKHPDVLAAIFDVLREKGRWVKAHPDEAAQELVPVWGNLPAATIALANSRRSYEIVAVRRDNLREQQRIADAYFESGLIPQAITASDVRIWAPQAQ
ncbi:MAG TPA: aliphatic sulfonate ABC transporter substrate-binding protein [Pararobbsia sp.]|nr:aliphatic sulfonate ABC transporter substrate-binding protein [Pararobbsia sp.]